MDKDLQKAVKRVIQQEIGEMVSEELKIRFKPISQAVDTIQKSNDAIAEQIREDRKDINQLKIDVAKNTKQGGVIIENQNLQEEHLAEVVQTEAGKIPEVTKKAVENMFKKKNFLIKLRERFFK